MIGRIIWTIVAAVTTLILFYVSRFWDFRLWGRDEFFGLRPQGGYVGQWLRGTDFAPFELLIWAVGAFAILTVLQKLFTLLTPTDEGEPHD